MSIQQFVVGIWKEKLPFCESVATAKQIVVAVDRQQWPFAIALAPNPFAYVGVANSLAGSSPITIKPMSTLITPARIQVFQRL
ncbi:MAG: hypothetical protein H8E66_30530 [Planctomycetes bacterium]|nr:hypothetical protein [Planctomycetota bacterium]